MMLTDEASTVTCRSLVIYVCLRNSKYIIRKPTNIFDKFFKFKMYAHLCY